MIKIVRKRCRTVRISIDRDLNIVVKAPNRVDNAFVMKVVESHKKWIETQRRNIIESLNFENTFDFENNLYILGKKYPSKQENKEIIYKQVFEEKIKPMVEKLVKETKLNYNVLSITKSKRFWGSLDRKFNMKLNIKVVCLREELIKYIIIHELCHGKQFNHSKMFWNYVGFYCPNYKLLKEELNKYSFLLGKNIY